MLLRRFMAAFYDAFIIFSFSLFLTAFALMINKGQPLLPYRTLFLSYLFVCNGIFLSWFWCKNGQTLGMLAWKIKLVDRQGNLLKWPQAFKRYCFASMSLLLLGLGWWWCFVDENKQSLHDRFAKTELIRCF
jgi:uncharacterized RDD family membrane protein YckC